LLFFACSFSQSFFLQTHSLLDIFFPCLLLFLRIAPFVRLKSSGFYNATLNFTQHTYAFLYSLFLALEYNVWKPFPDFSLPSFSSWQDAEEIPVFRSIPCQGQDCLVRVPPVATLVPPSGVHRQLPPLGADRLFTPSGRERPSFLFPPVALFFASLRFVILFEPCDQWPHLFPLRGHPSSSLGFSLPLSLSIVPTADIALFPLGLRL